MRTIGNILWFIFGGFLSGLSWWLFGALWCITIVGIPVGLQCFKLASVSFWPFKKEIYYEGGAVSCIVNVLWFFFGGIEMAALNAAFGLIWCITIVGIPFGMSPWRRSSPGVCPGRSALRRG